MLLDSSGDVWALSNFGENVTKLSNAGTPLSGSNGFTAGISYPYAMAIDGAGNIWITNDGPTTSGINNVTQNIIELSNSGKLLSGPNNYTAGGQIYGGRGVAVDGSGDVWIANHGGNSVIEMIGAAVPVITPIAAGLPATPTTDGSSNLGTRP